MITEKPLKKIIQVFEAIKAGLIAGAVTGLFFILKYWPEIIGFFKKKKDFDENSYH